MVKFWEGKQHDLHNQQKLEESVCVCNRGLYRWWSAKVGYIHRLTDL